MCVRVCVRYACVCAQSTPSDDAVDDKKPALYRIHTRVLNALKTSLWIRAATQPKKSAKIIKTDHGRKNCSYTQQISGQYRPGTTQNFFFFFL